MEMHLIQGETVPGEPEQSLGSANGAPAQRSIAAIKTFQTGPEVFVDPEVHMLVDVQPLQR